MRYIRKNIYSDASKLLRNWEIERIKANQNLAYNDFNDKNLLNRYLIEEQGGICCYCQQKVTKMKIGNTGDCHNEHLLPQNGPNARKDKQIDSGNIFACCCYSSGLPKHLQHCGESKGDKLIYDFIKWINCSSYFKYNTIGEIMPNGNFNKIEEYIANEAILSEKQKQALDAIDKLKLNQDVLKDERKKDIIVLIKALNNLSFDEVQEKIKEINIKPYPRFVDMLLYYMRKKAE
ncbi:hypothetical protein LJC38_03305 [Parabacteroides sp. OttesenSCG-928-K15]|nr:hypothetical protein [Parabacteroides sp. OttesenSCG-928-K15]